MLTLRRSPLGALGQFVATIWYRCGVGAGRARLALATGGADLTVNLQDEALCVFHAIGATTPHTFRMGVVHGAQSRYFVLGARTRVHAIGVHFRPGGGALLGLRSDELTDVHAALEDVWGVGALALRDELLSAPTPAGKIAVMEHALLQRLRSASLVHPVVSFAVRQLQAASAPRVAELQTRSGYSARRFHALFVERVGLAPKQFARVARLQRLVEHAARAQGERWAQLASEFGYYDQAHLAHEFRALTGVAPSAYRPDGPSNALHMTL